MSAASLSDNDAANGPGAAGWLRAGTAGRERKLVALFGTLAGFCAFVAVFAGWQFAVQPLVGGTLLARIQSGLSSLAVGVGGCCAVVTASLATGKNPLRFAMLERFRLADFLRGVGAAFVTYAIVDALQFVFFPATYAFNTFTAAKLAILPVCVVIALVQTFGEEYWFRGYLLKAWGGASASPWMVALALSLLFTLIHPKGQLSWPVWAAVTISWVIKGMIPYWLVFRTRSLGSAWGAHFGNNAFLWFVIGHTASGDTSLAVVISNGATLSFASQLSAFAFVLVQGIATAGLLFALLAWRRSPFYIAKAVS